ncbi:MAG: glycosyltransferase family 2 protein, partial [Actinobacteria bacterium]|nr:glycosyltransferase family 2 protein [Actinomycetota bacterium]
MKHQSLVVIVTYNSSDFIEDCLTSIARQDYRDWYLVIVDNNSADSTVRKIRELRNQFTEFGPEKFRLIHLRKNTGFAGAVNHAVFEGISGKGKRKQLRGTVDFEYLVLLNPDVRLFRDSLESLLGTFREGKNGEDGDSWPEYRHGRVPEKQVYDGTVVSNRIGVCGGLILDYEKDVIQHMGGRKTSNFITYHEGSGMSVESLNKRQKEDMRGESFYRYEGQGRSNPEDMDLKESKIRDVDYVTGAFFATRFSIFKKMGGFDRGYRPVYFEELDYCMKLKRAGWRIVTNPGAGCRHFEGASVKKFSGRFYRHYHKNRIRCAVINLSIHEFLGK